MWSNPKRLARSEGAVLGRYRRITSAQTSGCGASTRSASSTVEVTAQSTFQFSFQPCSSSTPNTGHISVRSERAGHEVLVRWALAVTTMLDDRTGALSTFIAGFARPIDLASIPAKVLPTYVAVDVPELTEQLLEAPPSIRLLRARQGGVDVLTNNEVKMVLAALEREFAVKKETGKLRVIDEATNRNVAFLNIGKTRISLRDLELPEIDGIFVESTQHAAGQDDASIPLNRYIDRNNLFTVLFKEISIVYLDGSLFRDGTLRDGSQICLSYIRADASLNNVVDEKGTFTAGHRSFDDNSVFGAIVSHIAHEDDVLVCDDLGDEWADFIGANGTSRPKSVSFYHAKHGDVSLGASHLHIEVSQAMKNLGRMNFSTTDLTSKMASWTTSYNNDNVQTAIPRIAKGDRATAQAIMADAQASPDAIRRVFIVTSSLSRRQLEVEFDRIRGGGVPKPHFVQLYWLMITFFSACNEVGAYPYIICRE